MSPIITINSSDILRVRNSLGRITDNIKLEKKLTPRRIGNIVKKSVKELIKTESYQGPRARHGPYRRSTGKGLGDSITVIKDGDSSVVVRPMGYPEVYAIPVEEGHNSPINGPVKGKYYFRRGKRMAGPKIKLEIEKAAKRIMRK